jgi:hypothetical protein
MVNQLVRSGKHIYRIVGFWNNAIGIIKSTLDEAQVKFKDIIWAEVKDLQPCPT